MNAHQRRVQARRELKWILSGKYPSHGTYWPSEALRGYLSRLPRSKILPFVTQLLEMGKSRAGADADMATTIAALRRAEKQVLQVIVCDPYEPYEDLGEEVAKFLLVEEWCDHVKSMRPLRTFAFAAHYAREVARL